MSQVKDVEEFQDIIGYQFVDLRLLERALTHSSYANEHRLSKFENNERLEFLGDAVLEIITSEFLFRKYDEMLEGELTKFRASIVCEPTLANFSREINLGDYLLLGKGEDNSGGRLRSSVLSDAVEALIGAIYLDGGLEEARIFVESTLLKDVEKRKLFVDSKTHLQEIIQKNSDQSVEYVIVSEKGPDHSKLFEVIVVHEDKTIGHGFGRSKKSAEQEAAFDAIKKIV
ncbi:ribonuclease III [Petrocella sp. FN5]|uniref:ribonuclease III n=1 Tax=Petrocella sp. FN5 TaxID=3032002 RepID=UPI0023DA0E10|nr:ribonuclease III [Petrocella sp. FN5]MDF1616392.1 ribonuclease III [Petrocella sp. FN5]